MLHATGMPSYSKILENFSAVVLVYIEETYRETLLVRPAARWVLYRGKRLAKKKKKRDAKSSISY